MLILIASWAVILVPSLLVGTWLLPKQAEREMRPGDRVVIAIWLGVLALALGLMGLALLQPLRPLWVGSFLALATVASVSSSVIRQTVLTDLRSLRKGHLLIAAGLLLLMAWTCSREVTLFDTGLYHAQMLKMQREYGTIAGGALLHHRLGYNSSWFSLGSIFPAQTLGGMISWVSLMHLGILWRRIHTRHGETSDWFAAIAYSLVLPVLLMEGGLAISPSPDTPAALAIVLLAWWGMIDPADRSGRLIFAILAFPLKLSLLPLLIVGSVWWIGRIGSIGGIRLPGRIHPIRPFLLTLLLLIPVLTSYKSSGCPIYPSSVGCLQSVPWAMPTDQVAAIQQMTIDYARDGGRNLPDYHFWTWFPRSFVDPYTESLTAAALLTIFSVFATVLLLREAWRNPQFDVIPRFPIALAVVGLIYLFLTAPSLRFSIGYLSLLPAFLLAYWRAHTFALMGILPPALMLLVPYVELEARPYRLFGLLLAITLYGLILLRKGKGRRLIFHLIGISTVLPSLMTTGGSLVRPGPLPVPGNESLVLQPLPGGGRVYLTTFGPLGNQCWDAPLPCTPEKPLPHLRLLRPEVGVRGGFRWSRP